MDGENNGKPYEQMDDLGGFPIFLETPIYPRSLIASLTLKKGGKGRRSLLSYWLSATFQGRTVKLLGVVFGGLCHLYHL